MHEAYIVDAVRTPITRTGGDLSGVHAADLGAHVLKNLIDRADLDSAAVDDVVFGCLNTLGSQAFNIARTSWLAAGLSEEVPGVTIDRQCGSSQQAVQFAAQGIMSGTVDLVIAGGVQNMSTVPISSAGRVDPAFGEPFLGSDGWTQRYGRVQPSQFTAAEQIAQKWSITRDEMEEFALTSHRRAVHAIEEGRFEREIIPLGAVSTDSCPRRDTSLEKMAALRSISPDGLITAGLASQNCDGAAAVLLASERAVREHNLRPRARIHHVSCRGADPTLILTAPIPATQRALERTGLGVEDIDLFEANEAFASVVLAWEKELGIDHAKVNVNGGAIALGHPLGATGSRLMTTLLHELERTGGRFGLQTMCEGGGLANVTIIERLA
ncbi:acetyl-CoA C-acetyltransferase [Rhodococcus sp. B50]|uniref:acetyl-CoA C-acetyltransferase n=1 Tax=Rhodococcus sp. B50 TaxID=2682847 RepID=UPI001BD333E4|nr:acetyl-CoA C-acetyltransferase [Rhodococcus sp. B50]MBS9376287.1 Steroid 3-ketoacyl-CoA thiolase [Rhodococcus sp. B50]